MVPKVVARELAAKPAIEFSRLIIYTALMNRANKINDMALNGSGIRDTSRLLGVGEKVS